MTGWQALGWAIIAAMVLGSFCFYVRMLGLRDAVLCWAFIIGLVGAFTVAILLIDGVIP